MIISVETTHTVNGITDGNLTRTTHALPPLRTPTPPPPALPPPLPTPHAHTYACTATAPHTCSRRTHLLPASPHHTYLPPPACLPLPPHLPPPLHFPAHAPPPPPPHHPSMRVALKRANSLTADNFVSRPRRAARHGAPRVGWAARATEFSTQHRGEER